MLGEIKDILVNQLKFLHLTFNWVNVVEVLIIAAFLLLVYQKFIKGTQSEKLVKGIFILLLPGYSPKYSLNLIFLFSVYF